MLVGGDRYEAEYQRICKESDESRERANYWARDDVRGFILYSKSSECLKEFISGLNLQDYKGWSKAEQLLSIKEFLTESCFKGKASQYWSRVVNFYEVEGLNVDDDETIQDLLNECIQYMWSLLDLQFRLSERGMEWIL